MKSRLISLVHILVVAFVFAAVSPAAKAQPSPAAPKPAEELRIGASSLGTEALDPSLNSGSDVKMAVFPMFDMIVGATPDGKLSKNHGLARDWTMKHYKDHSTYTLFLRKEVKFHDGVEVTAEDVKFSLEYMGRPKCTASGCKELKSIIDRIEIPERYKVLIHTKAPYSLLLEGVLSPIMGALCAVLPKHYIEKYGEAYFNSNPIGSGAYKFKERVTGSHVKLEAWEMPHWLYGVPRFKYITIFIVQEESTRIAMLKRGEIDTADVSRGHLKEVAGYNIFRKKDEVEVMLRFFQFGPRDIYVRDPRVREALSLAIDREALVKHIFMGEGKVTGDAVMYGSRALGYQPLPIPKNDPKKARSLMEEAIRANGWDKVRITYAAIERQGTPELPLMGESMVGTWKEVFGELLDVTIWPTDYGTVRTHRSKKDMPNTIWGHTTANRYMGGWRTGLDPASPESIFYENEGAPYVDRKVLAMLDKLDRILDVREFGRAQREIAQYVSDKYYNISMVNLDRLVVANPKKIKKWDTGVLESDLNIYDLYKQK